MATLTNKKKLRRLTRMSSGAVAGRAVRTLLLSGAVAGLLAIPDMAAMAAVANGTWDGKTDVAANIILSAAGEVSVEGAPRVNGEVWGVAEGVDIHNLGNNKVTGTLTMVAGAARSVLKISGESQIAAVRMNDIRLAHGSLEMGGTPHASVLEGGLGGGSTLFTDMNIELKNDAQIIHNSAAQGADQFVFNGGSLMFSSTEADPAVVRVKGTGSTVAKLQFTNGATVSLGTASDKVDAHLVAERVEVMNSSITVQPKSILFISNNVKPDGSLQGIVNSADKVSLQIYHASLRVGGKGDGAGGSLVVQGDRNGYADIIGTDAERAALIVDDSGVAYMFSNMRVEGGTLNIKNGGDLTLGDAPNSSSAKGLWISDQTLAVGSKKESFGELFVAGNTKVEGELAKLTFNGEKVRAELGGLQLESKATLSVDNGSEVTFKDDVRVRTSSFLIDTNSDVGSKASHVTFEKNLALGVYGGFGTQKSLIVGSSERNTSATVDIGGNLTVGDFSNLTIHKGNTVNVGASADVSNTSTLLVNGTLNVANQLMMQTNTGGFEQSTADSSIKVGELVFYKSKKPALNVSNGTFQFTGVMGGLSLLIRSSLAEASDPAINVTGGTLILDGNGGTLAGSTSVSGGVVSIGMGTWSLNGVAATGGTITVGESKSPVLPADSYLTIADSYLTIADTLALSSSAVMNVKAGTVTAKNLSVKDTAKLTLTGGTVDVSGDISAEVSVASASSLEFKGGTLRAVTMEIAEATPHLSVDAGTLHFVGAQESSSEFIRSSAANPGVVTMTVSKGSGTAGTLFLDGEHGGSFNKVGNVITVSGGDLKFGNGVWNINEIAATAQGAISVGKSSEGEFVDPVINVKTLSLNNATMTVESDSTVNVLTSLDVQAGSSLNIKSGTVDLSGSSSTPTFKNAEDTIALMGGTLLVSSAQVYDANNANHSTPYLATGVNRIAFQSGLLQFSDKLTFNYATDSVKLKAFHDALLGSHGLWANITVNGVPETPFTPLFDGTMGNVIAADVAALLDANDMHQYAVNTTLTNGSAVLGAAAGQLALTGQANTSAANDVQLTISTSSTIAGSRTDKNAELVLGASGKNVSLLIGAGQTLNFGVIGLVAPGGAAPSQGYGKFTGKISGNDAAATFNVSSGEYIVDGTIALGAYGTLAVRADGKLTTTGDTSTKILELTDGELHAQGNVSTDTLTVQNNSKLLANGTGKSVTASGNMNISYDSTLEAKTLTLSNASGSHSIADSIITVGELNMSGGTLAIAANGTLDAGKLAMTSAGTISVGTDDGKGVLTAKEAALNGSTLFLDPAWKDGGTISNASGVAVQKFSGNKVDGRLVVGRNSHLSLGTDSTEWMRSSFANQGLTWGQSGITAAMGIFSPQSLDATKGALEVDGSLLAVGGSKLTGFNQAIFAANSLLVVRAEALSLDGSQTSLPALSSTGGKVTVDKDAKLLLTGAKDGTYTILNGFTGADSSVAATGWNGNNLIAVSYLADVIRSDFNAGKLSVTLKTNTPINVFPEISGGMAQMVEDLYAKGLDDVNSSNAGVAFVSRATSRGYIDAKDSGKVLESAVQTALAGGAPSAVFGSMAVTSSATAKRADIQTPASSMPQGISTGDESYSIGLWGMPVMHNSTISNQKAGNFKYGVDSKLFGGILGFDVTNPLNGGDFRLGAALSVGKGDTKSKGQLASTKSNYDFFGGSIYAGYTLEGVTVSGDVGYTVASSRIKQDLLSSLDMGSQLGSKVNAQALTLGLQASYKFRSNVMNLDITPSLSLRYTAYHQDSYDVTSQQGTVFTMSKANMNNWNLPVGVKFSRDFMTESGWAISPELRLAVIPAFGDTKISNTARIPGVNVSSGTLTGHVFDRVTGEVGLGLNIVRDNLAFGVNYTFQGGSHQRAHNVSGQLRYSF